MEKCMELQKKEIKKKLVDWGATLAFCSKQQEQMKKLMRLKEEAQQIQKDLQEYPLHMHHIVKGYEMNMEYLQQEIIERIERKNEIDRLVSMLSIEEQEFLHLRYEKGYGYDYIALKLHMGRSTCFRIHDKILQVLVEKSMKKNYKKCEKH